MAAAPPLPRVDTAPARLRVGFICGRSDGDHVTAPGIPSDYWCDEEPGNEQQVCTDVALWWFIHRHFPGVAADLILPSQLSAGRLQSNDINLLLGYDAVSAHIEEHDASRSTGSWHGAGHGQRMAALLRHPDSHVWPPGEVQDLVNLKSNYLLRAVEHGIPIAPTEVYRGRGADNAASGRDGVQAREAAAIALGAAAQRGWQQMIAKPVPSSWCLSVTQFDAAPLLLEQQQQQEEEEQEEGQQDPAAAGDGGGVLEQYFSGQLVRNAQEVLLQEFVPGLLTHPETRCFFYGGKFLYAVANSKSLADSSTTTSTTAASSSGGVEGGSGVEAGCAVPAPAARSGLEITASCESASDSQSYGAGRKARTTAARRRLGPEYWEPARALGERLHGTSSSSDSAGNSSSSSSSSSSSCVGGDGCLSGSGGERKLLPTLRGFHGQALSNPFPWMLRVDVGVMDAQAMSDRQLTTDLATAAAATATAPSDGDGSSGGGGDSSGISSSPQQQAETNRAARVAAWAQLHGSNTADSAAAAPTTAPQQTQPVFFLNEMEITPTLYLGAKFGHGQDFISYYARELVATAAEVVGWQGEQPQLQPQPQHEEPEPEVEGGSGSKFVVPQFVAVADWPTPEVASVGPDDVTAGNTDHELEANTGEDSDGWSSISSSSSEEEGREEGGKIRPEVAEELLGELSAETLAALRAHLG